MCQASTKCVDRSDFFRFNTDCVAEMMFHKILIEGNEQETCSIVLSDFYDVPLDKTIFRD